MSNTKRSDCGRTRSVPMAGALTVNDSEACLHGCLAGLGIIQEPEPAQRPLLARGELLELLHGHRPQPMPVTLPYAHRRLPRCVQAFMDWLRQFMAPCPARATEGKGRYSATPASG